MSRNKWYAAAILVVVAAIALGLVLGLTGGGRKQSTEGAQASLASAGMPSEGIQVHGHWTIDVKNPDGSLASHNEFENALEPTGVAELARLLARLETPGAWSVLVQGGSDWVRIKDASCPHNTPSPGSTVFYTLTCAVIGSGASSVLELHGTAQAVATANFTYVETFMSYCGNTVPPSQCICAINENRITHKDLPQPIPVQIGQQIIVTVDISFS